MKFRDWDTNRIAQKIVISQRKSRQTPRNGHACVPHPTQH